MIKNRSWAEPYKIKMVEPVFMTEKTDRIKGHRRSRIQYFFIEIQRCLHRPS